VPVASPDGTVLRTVTDPSGHRTVITEIERPGFLDAPPKQTKRPAANKVAWYVPYTLVHPATVKGAPKHATWIDVSSSPVAYYGALHDIWEGGESFALLEHDVVCRPDVAKAFEECPEPWCAFGYSDICHPECMEAWANMLGCTRFRSELVQQVPDAVSSIPADGWDWHNVCDGLGRNLRAAGFTHHWHFPAVEHHHMGRHDTPGSA